MYAELLVFMSAPLVVGAVIGAWLSVGRLYAARVSPGAARLPVWIPWALAVIAMLGGYVVLAGQLMAVSAAAFDAPVEWQAAAVVALLLSPAWVVSAAQAGFGIVLHDRLDALLTWLGLDAPVREGLAVGLRAAWGMIGLLSLYFGLQVTYRAALFARATVLGMVEGYSPARLALSLGSGGVAVLGMVFAARVGRKHG